MYYVILEKDTLKVAGYSEKDVLGTKDTQEKIQVATIPTYEYLDSLIFDESTESIIVDPDFVPPSETLDEVRYFEAQNILFDGLAPKVIDIYGFSRVDEVLVSSVDPSLSIRKNEDNLPNSFTIELYSVQEDGTETLEEGKFTYRIKGN